MIPIHYTRYAAAIGSSDALALPAQGLPEALPNPNSLHRRRDTSPGYQRYRPVTAMSGSLPTRLKSNSAGCWPMRPDGTRY